MNYLINIFKKKLLVTLRFIFIPPSDTIMVAQFETLQKCMVGDQIFTIFPTSHFDCLSSTKIEMFCVNLFRKFQLKDSW